MNFIQKTQRKSKIFSNFNFTIVLKRTSLYLLYDAEYNQFIECKVIIVDINQLKEKFRNELSKALRDNAIKACDREGEKVRGRGSFGILNNETSSKTFIIGTRLKSSSFVHQRAFETKAQRVRKHQSDL